MEDNVIKSMIAGIDKPVTLLDINFQKKLLKTIIEDNQGEFSTQIIDIIIPEYFDGIFMHTIIKYLTKYVEKYNLIPDYQTIRDLINEKETDGLFKENIIDIINTIEEQKITDKKNVQEVSLNFFRKQSLKKGLIKAVDEWEKGEYDSIAGILSEALKVGEIKNTGHNYIKDVEKRLVKKYRNPVSLMKGLDSKIGGGAAGGELVVILSPTGGGKSMMLVKFACNALEKGKKVVYYTLELSEYSIGNRFDSCLTQIPLKDVLEYPDMIREKMQELTDKGGELVIQEFPTGSASVTTIKNHLKSLEREGFVPDIIFIDYADIMKAVSNHSEQRHALTSIYVGIRGMAMELGIPTVTACQAGRCLGLDTIVETKQGKKKISELKLNEEILTHKGFKKVYNIYPIEKQTAYKIKLKSGKEIICSGQHLFPTITGDLKSINDGLKVGNVLLTKKITIQKTEKYNFNEIDLKMFNFDEIEHIELLGEVETIDISVEDTHMFYANDIYTHNSGMNKDTFDLTVISESIGKAQTADVILGLARSDEQKAQNKAMLMVLKNRNGQDGYSLPMHFDTSCIDISLEEQDEKFSTNLGLKGLGLENKIKANLIPLKEAMEKPVQEIFTNEVMETSTDIIS